MRLVLDTNVLIAAFVARGVCAELLEHCVGQHELVVSKVILHEFRLKLLNKLKMDKKDVEAAVSLLTARMEVVNTPPLKRRVSRDPDDDLILSTAVQGRCQCVVTGDKDLLVLKRFEKIEIVFPSGFWKYEAEAENR
jgi:putative PIN family toxin of toxin-antitoxin system